MDHAPIPKEPEPALGLKRKRRNSENSKPRSLKKQKIKEESFCSSQEDSMIDRSFHDFEEDCSSGKRKEGPLTAYQFFYKDFKQEYIKNKNGNYKPTALFKACMNEWNSLSKIEKHKYKIKEMQENDRFEEAAEITQYFSNKDIFMPLN